MAFSHSSRGRLTDKDLGRFPGTTLFDRIARAVCQAGCLPRKELYEAWEVARRVRRLFRGGRVVDLGGGHGLLAQLMLVLDDSSPAALVVDKALPASSARVHEALVQTWPRLSGRIMFVAQALDEVEMQATDVVVSSHACGRLTDVVLDRAVAARARVDRPFDIQI
jgi:ABC-type taurine transport system ATPase subunit